MTLSTIFIKIILKIVNTVSPFSAMNFNVYRKNENLSNDEFQKDELQDELQKFWKIIWNLLTQLICWNLFLKYYNIYNS